MAPISADTARSAPKQGQLPAPRVIPAIPFRLSRPARAARPLTPEESKPGALPLPRRESHSEPQPAAAVPEKDPKHDTRTTLDSPLTPESKTSGPTDAHGGTSAQTSPQVPVEGNRGEESRDTKDFDPDQHPDPAHSLISPSHTEPTPDAVNGARHVTAIPTQLPPPFYPADHRVSQSSAADRTGSTVRPLATQVLPHRARPSVENIVFGAAQESPAMPSTPHETEQDIHGQHQLPLRPPPGFAPPQFAPSFYPGHSHHPSDVATSWPHPGYSMAPPPDAVYGNGHDYNHGEPAVFQHPHLSRLSPGLAPPTANGSTTSHSQSPNKSHFNDARPDSDYGDEAQRIPYQNGNGPPGMRPEESHIALANWLSSQFGKPALADSVLQIRSPKSVLLSLPAHGVVVSRSPVIAEAMRRSVPTTHQSRAESHLIDILTSNKFLTSESLNEAVKFLYGAPLLSPPMFLFGLGPYSPDGEQSPTFHEARKRMAHALSYAAAGKALQLPILSACGADIAHALLRWDNVDNALHYGLDGFRQASNYDANGHEAPDTGTGAVLSGTIDFLAYHFPVDFKLCSFASELRDDPRLPALREPRTSHNPRLSKIRFGQATPEEELNPDYTCRTLSSILLSLPLVLLERLFNHRATANQLGWTSVVKVMQEVIEEREKRRHRVLQNHHTSNGNAPRGLTENLYYEERVERVGVSPLHPSGHRLVATRLSG